VAAAVGHSIFNRTSRTSVGQLLSTFGGGGHRGAGTCLLPAGEADAKIAEIIGLLKKDG
jgi:nanoRNase/pAp phosphatase (c-di-AMP/oligoRNAs hydrolase)